MCIFQPAQSDAAQRFLTSLNGTYDAIVRVKRTRVIG
jgi:hypothetical protein